MKVGFIGLGIMGRPMAKNVMKSGYDLTVYARNPKTLDEFKELGANIASSGKEVAEKCEVIILMLPNSPNVSDALFDENGKQKVWNGSYTIYVGGSQPDQRSIELTGKKPLEVEVISNRIIEIE